MQQARSFRQHIMYIADQMCLESLRKQTNSCKNDICVYSLLNMFGKLKELSRELHIVLIRYGFKTYCKRPGAPKTLYDYIFNTYLSQVEGVHQGLQGRHCTYPDHKRLKGLWKKSGAPNRIYEYIADNICPRSLIQQTRSFKEGITYIFCIRNVLKASESRLGAPNRYMSIWLSE